MVSRSLTSDARPYETQLREPGFAMVEAGRFFEGDSKVHRALRRITAKLDELDIPYAVSGGLALAAHGYYRTTDDVDILVTRESAKKIHEAVVGLGWVPKFEGSKHLRDATEQVKIEFLLTGEFPGDGKPKPVAFPEPTDVAEVIDGVRYLNLVNLIELKLASGMTAEHRGKDTVDVEELIRSLELPRNYVEQLSAYVSEAFLAAWERVNGRARRFMMIWRNKWLTSEATTIQEMRSKLVDAADRLRQMQDDGVTLDPGSGTGDDYALLVTDDPAVAQKYGMEDESEFWGEDGRGPVATA